MPRVRANAGNQASPMKGVPIPLNDDRQEKAQRLQSRQAAHTKQMDSYKAAVSSPAKKLRKSLGDGPSTPSQQQQQQQQQQDEQYPLVSGSAVTPMKRVPILANFEEWMKMATDNKINAANSWNFALIDYFHDMSLLREGDGVNFQKASCTLDGCVKIYTSRVDSVATETGKLLSGLAESRDRKKKGGLDGEEGDDGEGEEDEGEGEEEGGKKKSRKNAQRSAEATLVTTFDQLRLKKMELEFSVDPLFKKASADFDEGGAKGLLLNHLAIDGTGRIVFDSSDGAQEDALGEGSRRDSMEPENTEGLEKDDAVSPPAAIEDGPVDIAALGARFFPHLHKLDEQDICPTLQTFELGSADASLDLPFLKAPENWRDEHPESNTTHPGPSSDDNDNFDILDIDDNDNDAAFDLPPETGFGEGGEAWARDAALHLQTQRVYYNNNNHHDEADATDEGAEVGTFDTNSNTYGVTLQHRDHDQENILNYFDAALHKNWAGPEHWKIAKIKDKHAAAAAAAQGSKEKASSKKEKENFEIDFAAPMTQDLASLLYTPAASSSGISLPKKDWKCKGRNLLPDDKHFNSKDLLRLFLKPKARIGAARKGSTTTTASRQRRVGADDGDGEGEIDEAYWATNSAPRTGEEEDVVRGDYDANFFQDDNLPPLPGGGAIDAEDYEEFADAREHFSPALDDVDSAAAGGGGPEGPGIDGIVAGSSSQGEGPGDFGANLVAQSRRLRPEYVQYARVAKKVDVRRLKEEMWRGIGFEELVNGDDGQQQPPPPPPPPQTPVRPPLPPLAKDDTGSLSFVDIMNNLKHAYPKQQMEDISTSFGFISLLHLANEKGLMIENVDGWQDLKVRKDFAAVVTVGGE